MTEIYHIDEPNQSFRVSSEKTLEGYFYAILYNPSKPKIILLRDIDKNKTWFHSRKECLSARIANKQRVIDFEQKKLDKLS